MERVQRGFAATLTQTVTVDGVPTAPSPNSATVTITRADGTAVVTAAAATNGGVGVFTYTLSPTQTALLDTLTIVWNFTLGGSLQSVTDYVEVVGGFLFTTAALRELDPLDDTVTYTDARIRAARTMAEEAIEDACGVAFVPRYRYRTISAVRGYTLDLWDMNVTSVRSASISGAALSEADLDALTFDSTLITGTSRWYPGPVTVGYEYGMPFPPAQVSRAAMLLARSYLVDSPIDDRYTSVATDVGTFSLITPGMRGAVTAIPEVNAIISQYRVPVVA